MTEKTLEQYCKDHQIKDLEELSCDEIIQSLGLEIVVKTHSYDPGVTFYLVKDQKKHGLLIFEWESWAETHKSSEKSYLEELKELREFFKKQIIWKRSLKECCIYILEKDFGDNNNKNELQYFLDDVGVLIGRERRFEIIPIVDLLEMKKRFKKTIDVIEEAGKEPPKIKHTYGMYATKKGEKSLLYTVELTDEEYENSPFSKSLELIK